MENSPQISIIVPVYNTGADLPRCLNSILAQTFTDWECICVDDGSKDESGKILDEYAAKDSRFVVIHQANAGVSAARNVGLKNVRGNYIGFVDSDDWIERETYETAIRISKEKKADLVQWTFQKEGLKLVNRQEKLFSIEEDANYFDASMCDKLIRRDLVLGVEFPTNIRLSEDRLFSFVCYMNSEGSYYINKAFYHYEIRDASASHSVTKEMLLEEAAAIKQMEQLANSRGKKMAAFIYKNKVASLYHAILLPTKPELQLARNMYPEINTLLIKERRKFSLVFLLVYMKWNFMAEFIIWLWKKYRKPV